MRKTTFSPRQTEGIASEIAGKFSGGEVVALVGPVGAGKTVFARGLARGLGIAGRKVRSPSFVIVMEHHGGRLPFFHFDCYRFASPGELETTPFEEYRKKNGVIVLEWPAMVDGLLPPETITVSIRMLDRKSREITISGFQPLS